MQHEENKNKIWYKVTDFSGRSLENINEEWPLPSVYRKGEWHSIKSQLGTLLVTNPKPFYIGTSRVFVADLDRETPIVEIPGAIWVRKARLVREASNKELTRLGMYRTFGALF